LVAHKNSRLRAAGKAKHIAFYLIIFSQKINRNCVERVAKARILRYDILQNSKKENAAW